MLPPSPRPQTASQALRACLSIIQVRETRYRVQWYYQLYEECQVGLGRDEKMENPLTVRIERIHGSLVACGAP